MANNVFTLPLPVTGPITDAELRASPVPVFVDSIALPADASTASKQDEQTAILEEIRDNQQTDALTEAELRASPVVVDTGLVQPTTPADTQPVSAAALPLPSGASTAIKQDEQNALLTQIRDNQLPDNHQVQVTNSPTEYPLPDSQHSALAQQTTLLSVLSSLATAITKLEDIYSAVDGLEATAESIEINSETINLNTDDVELHLQQIRDRLPSVLGQLSRVNSLGVTLSTEDIALITSLVTKLDSIISKLTPGSAGINSSVAGTTTNSTVLLASNANRKGATVFNDNTSGVGALLYISLGGTCTSTNFSVRLAQGSYYEIPFRYTGPISCVFSMALGNARVTEIT